MSNSELRILAVLAVVAGLAFAFWHFRDDILPEPDVSVIAPTQPAEEPVPGRIEPLHPIVPVPASEIDETDEIEELPPLDASDESFLVAVIDTLGVGIEGLLVNDALIDRFVATIDNLPRKHVSEKIRPIGRLATQFNAEGTPDDASFNLGSENFARYDALIGLMATADPDTVVAVYRRYYPLFQESYERLGYPNAYFNDRVIEVIDHLLLTPEPQEPVRLIRPHVLYQFADPELEALSSGQKLLLRMGNEHAAAVKQALQDLRSRLIARAVVD